MEANLSSNFSRVSTKLEMYQDCFDPGTTDGSLMQKEQRLLVYHPNKYYSCCFAFTRNQAWWTLAKTMIPKPHEVLRRNKNRRPLAPLYPNIWIRIQKCQILVQRELTMQAFFTSTHCMPIVGQKHWKSCPQNFTECDSKIHKWIIWKCAFMLANGRWNEIGPNFYFALHRNVAKRIKKAPAFLKCSHCTISIMNRAIFLNDCCNDARHLFCFQRIRKKNIASWKHSDESLIQLFLEPNESKLNGIAAIHKSKINWCHIVKSKK